MPSGYTKKQCVLFSGYGHMSFYVSKNCKSFQKNCFFFVFSIFEVKDNWLTEPPIVHQYTS